MEQCKQILKKLFFLPLLPTVLIAAASFAFLIVAAALQIDGALAYASYVASGYGLAIIIIALMRVRGAFQTVKERIKQHPITKKLLRTSLGDRLAKDVRFRTKVSLWCGFCISLLYIALKLVSGIYYGSLWFLSIAAYYVLLAIMRLSLLRQDKNKRGRTGMETELHRYRLCGIMLLVMNQALAVIVIFMVQQNQNYEYPGLLIYAMAAYAFYAVIHAVISLVRYRKHGSPALSAAKVISFVSAMVSILALETAMVTQFGSGEMVFRQVMTGALGGSVCTMVLAMAVFMIWKSTKQLKKLQINISQTEQKHCGNKQGL